jgi:hypothetical protein
MSPARRRGMEGGRLEGWRVGGLVLSGAEGLEAWTVPATITRLQLVVDKTVVVRIWVVDRSIFCSRG